METCIFLHYLRFKKKRYTSFRRDEGTGEIINGCMSVGQISISIKQVPVGSRINLIQLIPSLPTPPLGFCWVFLFGCFFPPGFGSMTFLCFSGL